MNMELEGVHETLLIPLWARAEETLRSDPLFRDDLAVSIVERIPYDFSKFSGAWMSQTGVAIRTMLLDRETRRFIEKHDDAVIVNIGAGLDTRCRRIRAAYAHWYDLDMPNVIELRKHFFKPSANYTMIGKSVFDYSWIDDIAADGRPVLIVAEGLLMYFEEAEVRELMNALTEAFPSAEMLFEILKPLLVNQSKRHDAVKHTSARFKWGVKSGRIVESFNSRITFIDEWQYFDFHPERLGWVRWPARIPAFKQAISSCIAHVAFGENRPCECSADSNHGEK